MFKKTLVHAAFVPVSLQDSGWLAAACTVAQDTVTSTLLESAEPLSRRVLGQLSHPSLLRLAPPGWLCAQPDFCLLVNSVLAAWGQAQTSDHLRPQCQGARAVDGRSPRPE